MQFGVPEESSLGKVFFHFLIIWIVYIRSLASASFHLHISMRCNAVLFNKLEFPSCLVNQNLS